MADGAALCLRRLRARDSLDFESVWTLLRDGYQLAAQDQGWHDASTLDSISDTSIGERDNFLTEIVGNDGVAPSTISCCHCRPC